MLSLAGDAAILLRPGMVSKEQIEDVIGPVQLGGARTAKRIRRLACIAATTARGRR